MQVKEYEGQERALARRGFLGSAVVLGAGAAIGTTLSFPSTGMSLLAAGRTDLVHDELIRQLTENVRALRGARPGEAARSVAATLRLLAAHYQASGVDTDVQKRLRAAIAREGREGVLRWEGDATMRAAEARRFGMADLALPREPFDRQARDRALSGMLSTGVTPALRDTADALERLAPQLDRRGVSVVAARQSGCPDLTAQLLALEWIAITSCLINAILCAGFQGMYWGLKAAIYMAGC